MKLRIFLILSSGLVLVAILAWFLYFRGAANGIAPARENIVEIPTPTPAPPQRAVLLFAGSDGLLHPELREIPLPVEMNERIRAVVLALLEGPHGRLAPIFPYPAELRSVFVDLHGRAFVDLSAPPEELGGTSTECMLVYGVVDSILLNTDLKSVQLLFNGREKTSLTGHLDISRPLSLDKDFIGR